MREDVVLLFWYVFVLGFVAYLSGFVVSFFKSIRDKSFKEFVLSIKLLLVVFMLIFIYLFIEYFKWAYC
jgi:hypothetical protein